MCLQRLVAIGPTGYFNNLNFRNVFFSCNSINSSTMNNKIFLSEQNHPVGPMAIMVKYFQYTLFFQLYLKFFFINLN